MPDKVRQFTALLPQPDKLLSVLPAAAFEEVTAPLALSTVVFGALRS